MLRSLWNGRFLIKLTAFVSHEDVPCLSCLPLISHLSDANMFSSQCWLYFKCTSPRVKIWGIEPCVGVQCCIVFMSNLQHMNVEKDPLKSQCGPDIHIHNSSTVGVYLTVNFFCKAVSTVDVAVVLPVEGGIYSLFSPRPPFWPWASQACGLLCRLHKTLIKIFILMIRSIVSLYVLINGLGVPGIRQ